MIPLIRFANRAVKENNPAAGNKSDIVIGDITKNNATSGVDNEHTLASECPTAGLGTRPADV